nr:MAG TPA: hypothetical protein [Caudoviricetes sp.]
MSTHKEFKPEVNALGFFICGTPHTEPTAWDPSAREPALHYPHIARLSRAFLFRPQTINSRCPVAIVSDGHSYYTNSTPFFRR